MLLACHSFSSQNLCISYILRELLNHDLERRPTCFLLQWNLLAFAGRDLFTHVWTDMHFVVVTICSVHQGRVSGIDEIDISATLKALRVGVATVGEDLPPPINPTKAGQVVSRDILHPFTVCLTLRSQPSSDDDETRATELRLMLRATAFRVFLSYYILQQCSRTAALVHSSILQFQQALTFTSIPGSQKDTCVAPLSQTDVTHADAGGIRDVDTKVTVDYDDRYETDNSEPRSQIHSMAPALARALHHVGANIIATISEVSVCMLADCDAATVGVVFRVTDPSASLTQCNGGFKLLLSKYRHGPYRCSPQLLMQTNTGIFRRMFARRFESGPLGAFD